MIKNKSNLIRALALAGIISAMTLCAAACDSTDKPEETEACTSHIDADANGKCDKCSAEVETVGCTDHIDVNGDNKCEICGATVVEPINFTISLKDEDGAPISDISVSVRYGSEETASGITGADGVFSCEILPDRYTVFFDGVPEGWIIAGNGSSIAIDKDNASAEFIAEDNNPDGSAEKPYYIGDEPVATDFEAGETYNFFIKGAADTYVVIYAGDVKLTVGDKDHYPEHGILRVFIRGTGDTNSNIGFTITNTADSAKTVVTELEAIPGSLGAPFDAFIGENTAVVPGDRTVYHSITAPGNGYLTLYCQDPANYIMMQNVTSSVVTKYTDGGSTLTIPVSAGDSVLVLVAARSLEDDHSVKFELEMCGATAESPLVIKDNCTLRLPTKGGIVITGASGIKTLTISSAGVTLTDASGNAVEAVDGVYTVEINDGDIFTLSNTTGTLKDVEIKTSRVEE